MRYNIIDNKPNYVEVLDHYQISKTFQYDDCLNNLS